MKDGTRGADRAATDERDRAAMRWIASNPEALSSIDRAAFSLTPLQEAMGMTKSTVFVAAVASGDAVVVAPTRAGGGRGGDLEEAQRRFEIFQAAFVAPSSSSSSSGRANAAATPALRLSPRMAPGTSSDLGALRVLYADIMGAFEREGIETEAKRASERLEAELSEESQRRAAAEGRRRRKLKKSRDRKKGKSRRADTTTAEASREDKDNENGKLSSIATEGSPSSSTNERPGAPRDAAASGDRDGASASSGGGGEILRDPARSPVGTSAATAEFDAEGNRTATVPPVGAANKTYRDIVLVAAPELTRGDEEEKEGGDARNDGGGAEATRPDLVPPTLGDDATEADDPDAKLEGGANRRKVGLADARRFAKKPSAKGDVGTVKERDGCVLLPPPGIPNRSYLDAVRVSQLRAEVRHLRDQLRTERSRHLEALQQVQLKAFISETRANAEAERAQNLERRLEKVIGQGGVGAYLDEGRNDERLPVGMGTGA